MSSEQADSSSIIEGQRFVSDDNYGTVRYIGEVPPTKGIWLGVEWDDPARGKHDGTHKGVKYFNCRFPTGGSFLRPAKAELGCDFISALEEKYIPNDMETGDVEAMQLAGKTVEMVGAGKIAKRQSSFQNLREVVLRCENIAAAGEADLGEKVPNIEILNISKNLFSSWEEVGKITSQLSRLSSLDISENKLSIPKDPSSVQEAFQHISSLAFNRADISWSQVLECAPMWPNLTTLHICFNNLLPITSIPETIFQSLELLNVEGNGISNWDDVLIFGRLPKLNSLILSDNMISDIYFNDCEPSQKTEFFPNLKMLSLNRNKIETWKPISQLEKLKQLESLNFKFNPISEKETPEDIREATIAKIGSLKSLNYSSIAYHERTGAELMYLKNHGKEWLENGGNRDLSKSAPTLDFRECHPRFERLVEIYDAPDAAALEDLPNDLKSTLLEVTITCPQKQNKKDLKKKLPSGMEIQKLKSLLQKVYKIDMYDQRLYYHQEGSNHEIELDNDLRSLDFFAVGSGDIIVVKYTV